MLITRGPVAEKFAAYLHHELQLDSLVAWADRVWWTANWTQYISQPFVRLWPGSAWPMCAPPRLTQEDREQLFPQLGYSTQISIAAR